MNAQAENIGKDPSALQNYLSKDCIKQTSLHSKVGWTEILILYPDRFLVNPNLPAKLTTTAHENHTPVPLPHPLPLFLLTQ